MYRNICPCEVHIFSFLPVLLSMSLSIFVRVSASLTSDPVTSLSCPFSKRVFNGKTVEDA